MTSYCSGADDAESHDDDERRDAKRLKKASKIPEGEEEDPDSRIVLPALVAHGNTVAANLLSCFGLMGLGGTHR